MRTIFNFKFSIFKKSGFVLLFAVTLASILLALALGVTNIALKEVKFSTSAKDANEAFFAADIGIESALFQDKAGTICSPAPCSFNFTLQGLGTAGQGCVKVSVNKTDSPALTTVVSKGYNVGNASCSSSNPDRIERELKVTYGSSASPPPPPPPPPPAGNSNLITVMVSGTPSGSFSISDTQGNSYIPAVSRSSPIGITDSIFYAVSTQSGSNTITASGNGGLIYSFAAQKWSGVATTPLDKFTHNSGSSGGAVSAGPVNPSETNELILGFIENFTSGQAIVPTPGAGFTTIDPFSYGNVGYLALYKIEGSSGNVNITGNVSASNGWDVLGATFRRLSGGNISLTQNGRSIGAASTLQITLAP